MKLGYLVWSKGMAMVEDICDEWMDKFGLIVQNNRNKKIIGVYQIIYSDPLIYFPGERSSILTSAASSSASLIKGHTAVHGQRGTTPGWMSPR